MTFEDFKAKAESYPGTDVGLINGLIIVKTSILWSLFPLDRTDKMEEILWNLHYCSKTVPDPTQPFEQLKLF